MGSSPDSDRTGGHRQTAGPASKTECAQVHGPVDEPSQEQNRLRPGGHGPASSEGKGFAGAAAPHLCQPQGGSSAADRRLMPSGSAAR